MRAAVSDAWARPQECESPRPLPASEGPPPEGLSVEVFAGDVRHRSPPPRIMVSANLPAGAAHEGVHFEAAPEVIPYGVNQILWRGGDWIEWTVEAPATAVGVQFWGPVSMGAARLLIDDQEVWRGLAADLGEVAGQYGGYVEVAGLSEGRHRVRVEHLQLDARPVNVLLLGVD